MLENENTRTEFLKKCKDGMSSGEVGLITASDFSEKNKI